MLAVVIVSVGQRQEQDVGSASCRFEVHAAVWAVTADIALAVHHGQAHMMISVVAAFVVGEKGILRLEGHDNWKLVARHKRIPHPLSSVVRHVE